jgi:biotin carboxyl carrier protein
MNETPAVFQVKANQFEFTLDESSLTEVDITEHQPYHFHLIQNNQSVNAVVQQGDYGSKTMRVEINGELFDVEIKDALDLMLDKMGFKTVSTKHIKEIKAPMPGLVVDVVVTEGQEVAEGDKLLILSAMKMENSILIHAAATIKKINVKPGEAVEKGQVLIELE